MRVVLYLVGLRQVSPLEDVMILKPWLSIKELLQANLHSGISTLLLPPHVLTESMVVIVFLKCFLCCNILK
jgi:hypothetical protein